VRKQWAHPQRPLKCGACRAGLGHAYWQSDELIVVDRYGKQVEPVTGQQMVAAARERSVAATLAAQATALDHPRREREPDAWRAAYDAAEQAAAQALAEVRRLMADTPSLTYELRCGRCRATPRRTSATLAAEVRDAPNQMLLVA
jgi:hypothetical protein